MNLSMKIPRNRVRSLKVLTGCILQPANLSFNLKLVPEF